MRRTKLVQGFEEWAKKKGMDVSHNNRSGDGYWYDSTQSHWECWVEAHKIKGVCKCLPKPFKPVLSCSVCRGSAPAE